MTITLSKESFLALCATGQTISAHGVYGPKVVLLPNGEYLKVFNPKSGLTKRRFFPKYKTFVRNAKGLAKRGIPTLHITQIIALPEQQSYAVRYTPLAGVEVRSLMKNQLQSTVEQLIPFLVHLHEKGIFFRGIHLGNIVRVNEGEFGLIDIADLSFKRGSLTLIQRVRNLSHMLKNKDDARFYRDFGVEQFLRDYATQAQMSGFEKMIFSCLVKFY